MGVGGQTNYFKSTTSDDTSFSINFQSALRYHKQQSIITNSKALSQNGSHNFFL